MKNGTDVAADFISQDPTDEPGERPFDFDGVENFRAAGGGLDAMAKNQAGKESFPNHRKPNAWDNVCDLVAKAAGQASATLLRKNVLPHLPYFDRLGSRLYPLFHKKPLGDYIIIKRT